MARPYGKLSIAFWLFRAELTGGFQGFWHQVLLRWRVGCLCRREQNGSDQFVWLCGSRGAMVDRKPHRLEARPSNNNTTVPAHVSNLRRSMSINRFLPVRSPQLSYSASCCRNSRMPLEFSPVPLHTVQLPVSQPPCQQTMEREMGITTMGSVCVIHPPSPRA